MLDTMVELLTTMNDDDQLEYIDILVREHTSTSVLDSSMNLFKQYNNIAFVDNAIKILNRYSASYPALITYFEKRTEEAKHLVKYALSSEFGRTFRKKMLISLLFNPHENVRKEVMSNLDNFTTEDKQMISTIYDWIKS